MLHKVAGIIISSILESRRLRQEVQQLDQAHTTTTDPWTIWIWTARVHLSGYFFSVVNTTLLPDPWLVLRMWNQTHRTHGFGALGKLYMHFPLLVVWCPFPLRCSRVGCITCYFLRVLCFLIDCVFTYQLLFSKIASCLLFNFQDLD